MQADRVQRREAVLCPNLGIVGCGMRVQAWICHLCQQALAVPLAHPFQPHPPSLPLLSQARTRGYKWAYGQAWRERRQREEALRRARSRSFVPAVPRFGIPRPPPFYPAPPPGHHPFIIGGDYDRLPQFGPNGGGMPGQLGGGHMFGGLGGGPGGGPSPFLGGSRRQGGRGSSGGFRMY